MDEFFKGRSELYVLRAQRGDPDGMNLLIGLWTPRLRSIIGQWAPPSLVDEVVQQVWLDVFGHLGSLNDPAYFPRWVRKISFRCAATLMRRRGSHLRLDPEASYYELAPSWTPVIIGLLGPTHRRVFTLHYLEGFSVEEIAESLGLPPGTIKSRLYTSRRLLRKRLGDSLEN